MGPPRGPWPGFEQREALIREADRGKFTEAQTSYWAFQPVEKPAIPHVAASGWASNPIDSFVRAKLEERGIEPAPESDRLTWLRRVSFDLTGLPPAPEAATAFLADKSPRAYERVIDQLLASPLYGER